MRFLITGATVFIGSELIASGAVRPAVNKVYPLNQVHEALL